MHKKLLIIALGAALAIPAMAQISVQIGIDLPLYPELQLVPGYPVYYAPQVQGNYFFYDGLYWEYEPSGWHVSSWYNGPWRGVGADQVPDFVLRVPLRYYRMPPPAFRIWTMDAAPRWDYVWGADWTRHHRDWNRWDRARIPAAAPLPTFQRAYSRDHYPDAGARQQLQQQYSYKPHDVIVRQHVQALRNEPVINHAAPTNQHQVTTPPHDARDAGHAAPAQRQDERNHAASAAQAAPAARQDERNHAAQPAAHPAPEQHGQSAQHQGGEQRQATPAASEQQGHGKSQQNHPAQKDDERDNDRRDNDKRH